MINLDLPALAEQAAKLATTAQSVKSSSLVQYTGATRVTPFTIVDRSLLTVSELQDTLQILGSLYSGYQIMGIQLSVNSIDGVSVVRHLDKLNPTRSSAKSTAFDMAGRYALSRENYQFRLPTGDKLKELNYPTQLAHESSTPSAKDQRFPYAGVQGYDPITGEKLPEEVSAKDKKFPYAGVNGHDPETGKKLTSSELGRNTVEQIQQDSNLAVGKLLEVNVTVGGKSFTIPVNVRLNTYTAAPNDIANIVANVDPHKSAKEVKALHQAGLISLWDALTGKTAAKEWRKAAMNDKTGVLMREQGRRTNNKIQGLLTGETSFGDISGIYVISANTAREVEGIIGAKLSNFRAREKLLEKTAVMLLAVVDPSWKTVTIYHHSLDSESVYSFSDLKRGGKSNNHDMGMVLEAFRQGQAPSKFF